jgi:hypothetical protein
MDRQITLLAQAHFSEIKRSRGVAPKWWHEPDPPSARALAIDHRDAGLRRSSYSDCVSA